MLALDRGFRSNQPVLGDGDRNRQLQFGGELECQRRLDFELGTANRAYGHVVDNRGTVTATSVQNSAISGTAAVTVNPRSAGANVAPIVVDAGPDPSTFISANVPFVTVTLCVPGTTTCQTIDHVTVDTGSSGFRVISSVLTIPLPAENLSSGNPLYECTVFADGFVWGPVATANITVAGESTSTAVPVQIMIPSTTSPAPPGSCSNQTTGPNEGGSVDAFGANAIIGVGLFQQDCGPACTTQEFLDPGHLLRLPVVGLQPDLRYDWRSRCQTR